MSRDQVLTHLRNLSAERPTTKMGQVRWAWPEIQAALAAGHTLQLVHQRLNEVGIGISYRTLSLYLGRLQRQGASKRMHGGTAGPELEKGEPARPRSTLQSEAVRAFGQPAHDPFANIRRERDKKKDAGFEYDAFSTNKGLLE
jgi:hypothetical protein